MSHQVRNQWIRRIVLYLTGVMLLAVGVTMGTSSGLGIASMSSFPYAISRAMGLRFAQVTVFYYCFLVALQLLMWGRHWKKRDLLQLPFSVVFSALMDVVDRNFSVHYDALWQNLLLQAGSIVLLGIGVALTVGMQIAPNPTDGLVYNLSQRFQKPLGLMKNLADTTSVALACVLDLIFEGRLVSVGLGTVLAMIFIGRVVALFNHCCQKRIAQLTGVAS